jgi:hypothetical protein
MEDGKDQVPQIHPFTFGNHPMDRIWNIFER